MREGQDKRRRGSRWKRRICLLLAFAFFLGAWTGRSGQAEAGGKNEEGEKEVTVSSEIEGLEEELPVLRSPIDFTAGEAVGTCPAYWLKSEESNDSYAEKLIALKNSQGYQLKWYLLDEEGDITDQPFDWYQSKVETNIRVRGVWEKYQVSLNFQPGNQEKTESITIPFGASYMDVFGKEKPAPRERPVYQFEGWYDSRNGQPFDFKAKLNTPSLLIYGKWRFVGSTTAVDVKVKEPEKKLSGECDILNYWHGDATAWGSTLRLSLGNFSGGLADAVVEEAICLDPGAANPCLTGSWHGKYEATLSSFDKKTGKATYQLVFSPPKAVSGDFYKRHSYRKNQRFGAKATVYIPVYGQLKLKKVSLQPDLSENHPLYGKTEEAEFCLLDKKGKELQTLHPGQLSQPLPPGSYTVKETRPPGGFYAAQAVKVEVKAAEVTEQTIGNLPYSSPIKTVVRKYDSQRGDRKEGNKPQGGGSLEGAEFTIDYYASFAYPDVKALEASGIKPSRSWVLRTDASGQAILDKEHLIRGDAFYRNQKGEPCLPRGTVLVRESKAPEGYIRSKKVSLQKILEGTRENELKFYQTVTVAEDLKRGDIEFTKKADPSGDRLSRVAFKISSLSSGESHIAVTDENGYFSSAASWNSHSFQTNENDWALKEKGRIDSSRLKPEAGFWFGGTDNTKAAGGKEEAGILPADDQLGALPYDHYAVEELPTSSNQGYQLIKTSFVISRNGQLVKFGSLHDHKEEPEPPSIATRAFDADDGDQTLNVGQVTIIDEVSYRGLEKGEDYTLKAEIYDVVTAEPIKSQGKPIEKRQSFVAEQAEGRERVEMTFSTADLQGRTVVLYESLEDSGGKKLAEHRELKAKSQQLTIRQAELTTQAEDGWDGDKRVMADPEINIKDRVHYSHLQAGGRYRLEGSLIEKGAGNKEGIILVSQDFTAASSSGDLEILFTFDGSSIHERKEYVVFERLFCGEQEIASHRDEEDEGQTVEILPPSIHTQAEDRADGDQELLAAREAGIRDTVSYENLMAGKRYKLRASLYDRSSGQLLKIQGKEVGAELIFTPSQEKGTVQLDFPAFDATQLGGRQLVIFEELYCQPDKEGGKEILLAEHKDKRDKKQTLSLIQPPRGGQYGKTGLDGRPWKILCLGLSGAALALYLSAHRRKSS